MNEKIFERAMKFLTAFSENATERRWEDAFQLAEDLEVDMDETVETLRDLGYIKEGKIEPDAVIWAILYVHLQNVKREAVDLLKELEYDEDFEVDTDVVWDYEEAVEDVNGYDDKISDEFDIWNYPSLKKEIAKEGGDYAFGELLNFLVETEAVKLADHVEIEGIPVSELPEEKVKELTREKLGPAIERIMADSRERGLEP